MVDGDTDEEDTDHVNVDTRTIPGQFKIPEFTAILWSVIGRFVLDWVVIGENVCSSRQLRGLVNNAYYKLHGQYMGGNLLKDWIVPILFQGSGHFIVFVD